MNMTSSKHFFQGIAAAAILLNVSTAGAQTCDLSTSSSTPASSFVEQAEGTLTDMRFGLMWSRCSVGQSWSGSTCVGSGSLYDWSTALVTASSYELSGLSGWRLPNKNELASLLDTQCGNPAINETLFPGTDLVSSVSWWTNSPSAASTYESWSIEFDLGVVETNDRSSMYQLRLVREID